MSEKVVQLHEAVIGPADVKLVVGGKCLAMPEAVDEVFPNTKHQRCTVHFYRNVFSAAPRPKVKHVDKMLKSFHAQKRRKAARKKGKAAAEELCAMKLKEAAKKAAGNIEETFACCDFPGQHRTHSMVRISAKPVNSKMSLMVSFTC